MLGKGASEQEAGFTFLKYLAVQVTLTHTIVFVPLQLAISLVLALLLNVRVPSMGTIRTV